MFCRDRLPKDRVPNDHGYCSSITWTQCEGCTICFPQLAPLFHPLNSDTYQKVECHTPFCDTVDRDCEETCNYAADYEDHLTSYGVFSTVTVTFETSNEGTFVTVPTVAFGCGEENEGVFGREVAGIVGVGRPSPSLINQLGDHINHKFSYCLPEQGTSTLFFGTPAHMPVLNLKSTSLLFLPNDPIYYILDLQDISVGKTRLRIPPGSFDPTDEQRSLTIDSGTAYTYLHRLVYDRLSQSLDRAIRLQRVVVSGTNLQLCYRVQNNLDFLRIPAVTFHFPGNNGDWKVGPRTLFVPVAPGAVCMGILLDIHGSVFGALIQRDMFVEYDLGRNLLSFSRTDFSYGKKLLLSLLFFTSLTWKINQTNKQRCWDLIYFSLPRKTVPPSRVTGINSPFSLGCIQDFNHHTFIMLHLLL
ncbi:hypothetical protein AMTRI_Chr02g222360 [Amborella trichopoda]